MTAALTFDGAYQFFMIRTSTAEYLTKVQITPNYLEYEFTTEPEQATRLNDFDSKLVLKRLRTLGDTSTTGRGRVMVYRGSDPSVTDYVLEVRARCLQCGAEINEKTLVEWDGN